MTDTDESIRGGRILGTPAVVERVSESVLSVAGSMHWSPCVIVADDDPGILRLVQSKLVLNGFCVHPLTSSVDVLTAIQLIPVDLVILDIVMPGVSGMTALEEMRSTPNLDAVPVILLSALSRERQVEAGYRAGAVDYITKPFSPGDLLVRVRAALAV